MAEPNPMDEILKISARLPQVVLEDINKRIGDWMAMGGNYTDPYIKQQLRFARRFVENDEHER
ncbi:MAG: hypothetical protein LKI04_24455 [Paenibacillus lautus]|jgi:hypothetical protein|uniref:DUF6877 family protein n=1 Tax=Paenibacillus lautus TaxID=1401 RepID=UPI0026F37A35|nr:DUF6877 family protein [Paenibacillus lautus]MCI1777166.1 hypothetical protein [Paenibacillus lautus]